MRQTRFAFFALIAFLYTFRAAPAYGQNFVTKYLNHVLKDTSDPAKAKFIAYPTLAYAPETSWEFGISGLFVYRARQDTSNRLSEIKSFSFLTKEKQYGSWIEHALYTHKNKFFILGELKFQDFPMLYYGIGPETHHEKNVLVNTTEFKLRERMLYQFKPSFFTGFEFDYQQLSDVEFEWDNGIKHIPHPIGGDGSANLSLGWGVLYDNRHNVLNTREGVFAELAFLTSHTAWGSDYRFTNYYSDFRWFKPSGKNNVIAFHAYGQFGTGNVPFNELSLMGGDRIMRGYYLGRYRDKNMVAAQAEYRLLPFPFSKRWGAAAFTAIGTVFPHINSFNHNHTEWAVGGGPRFLLFPKKDIYNRLDIAFTSEGTGFYFFIGEAF